MAGTEKLATPAHYTSGPDKVPPQAVAGANGGKLSMQDANYRGAEDNGPSCASCGNFSPPDQCAKVDGQVSPAAVCDLYAKKRDASDIAAEMMIGPQNAQ